VGQAVSLLESLLDALVRLDGEALVMHVGEKPYVVTTSASLHEFRGPLEWGQVELSTRVLTPEAVLGLLGEILPLDQRQELEDIGAIEYEIPRPEPGTERFIVIAARGGNDVWLEVRRRHGQEVETVSPPAKPEVTPEAEAEEPVAFGWRPGEQAEVEAAAAPQQRSAVILPISRSAVRPAPPPQGPAALSATLEHMLSAAAGRGASTVYVVSDSTPMIRVDGAISVLEAEPVFAASDVDRVVMELAPAQVREGHEPIEWTLDMPEAGRVRCVTFRDHRGPGIIFRMIPRAISVEQLGLSAEVQALCAQPNGLVLVTGPRASGKSTLLCAFVDLINRTRNSHVIVIDSEIGFVHESRRSVVSQREVRGGSEMTAAALASALREDPDVVVIEDLRSAEIVTAALEAAESGRLVFGSLRVSSAAAAIERVLELVPAAQRSQARRSLAASLRGVVAQALLRKMTGGRAAAREILLNTPAVATLIAEGKLSQLPAAIESGRCQGMVPLNEAIASLVREGTVHVAEAYRTALDREGLLALFKREGVDTSFAERLA
jgi:twitching motility protein PilT